MIVLWMACLFLSAPFLSAPILSQSDFTEKSGDILQAVLPLAALGSTMIYKDGSKPALQFIKTYGTTFILTHSLKRIIDKERPNGGNHAFPSGHTSSAFAGASFIQKRYGWKWGIPSYLLATYTGWTRIDSNHHDFWDVLGGAAIGIISAQVFAKKYDENKMAFSFEKSKHGIEMSIRITL